MIANKFNYRQFFSSSLSYFFYFSSLFYSFHFLYLHLSLIMRLSFSQFLFSLTHNYLQSIVIQIIKKRHYRHYNVRWRTFEWMTLLQGRWMLIMGLYHMLWFIGSMDDWRVFNWFKIHRIILRHWKVTVEVMALTLHILMHTYAISLIIDGHSLFIFLMQRAPVSVDILPLIDLISSVISFLSIHLTLFLVLNVFALSGIFFHHKIIVIRSVGLFSGWFIFVLILLFELVWLLHLFWFIGVNFLLFC